MSSYCRIVPPIANAHVDETGADCIGGIFGIKTITSFFLNFAHFSLVLAWLGAHMGRARPRPSTLKKGRPAGRPLGKLAMLTEGAAGAPRPFNPGRDNPANCAARGCPPCGRQCP